MISDSKNVTNAKYMWNCELAHALTQKINISLLVTYLHCVYEKII